MSSSTTHRRQENYFSASDFSVSDGDFVNVEDLSLSDKLSLSFEDGWGVAFSSSPHNQELFEVYSRTLFWLWSNGLKIDQSKFYKKSIFGLDVLCASIDLSELIVFLNELDIFVYLNEYGCRWVFPNEVSAFKCSIWTCNMLKDFLMHA